MEKDIAPRSITLVDQHPRLSDIRTDVLTGLQSSPKTLAPKLFYDQNGSELFEHITALPEYYPTRTEIGILRANAGEIVSSFSPLSALIELGSGNSEKVRILLDAHDDHIIYMPLDISRHHLEDAARAISTEYPAIEVVAVCTDYTSSLDIPGWETFDRRIFFFPGSTIGNFEPDDARKFLSMIAERQAPRDEMIIGVDLVKDRSVLEAAYNDSANVTAAFNLNVLKHINRVLGSSFDPGAFEHEALFNEQANRIEMHLRSVRDQTVAIGDERVSFRKGETIHTENSYKYTLDTFRDLIADTGFAIARTWMDPEELFSVHRLVVV